MRKVRQVRHPPLDTPLLHARRLLKKAQRLRVLPSTTTLALILPHTPSPSPPPHRTLLEPKPAGRPSAAICCSSSWSTPSSLSSSSSHPPSCTAAVPRARAGASPPPPPSRRRLWFVQACHEIALPQPRRGCFCWRRHRGTVLWACCGPCAGSGEVAAGEAAASEERRWRRRCCPCQPAARTAAAERSKSCAYRVASMRRPSMELVQTLHVLFAAPVPQAPVHQTGRTSLRRSSG